MINFIKSGDNLVLTAPYDVLSGGGFKVGNVFGVAANDTLSGADVQCEIEGVYDLAKDASTFAQGDLAYWDDSAKKVTSTVASNLLIGAVEVPLQRALPSCGSTCLVCLAFPDRRMASRWRMRKTISAWMEAPPARQPSATPFPTMRSCLGAW